MAIDTGWLADEVVLRVNNEDVLHKCTEYSVSVSVFQQPAAFTAKFGAKDIDSLEFNVIHDTEQPFELRLRHRPYPGAEPELDVPLQTGRVDKVQITDSPGTILTYSGRDPMRALFKSFFQADTSFSEKSYYDLVVAQLQAIGIDTDVDLLSGEEAREKMAVTGTQAKAPRTTEPPPDGKTEVVEQAESGTTRIVYNTITGNAGEQRFAWLKAQLQRAGLFLWCMSDGKFCIGAPNGAQEPAFEIIRRKNGEHNARLVNYVNDSTNLHHVVRVLGRAGGGKDGQRQIVGEFTSDTMQGRTERYETPETVRLDIDEQIRTKKEAEYKARRLASEERRAAFNLEYEVSGHTLPCILEPGKRTVPIPNFCCRLIDEWLGFDFPMYVGDSTFSRGGGTTTRVKLYRPADLVFAIEE